MCVFVRRSIFKLPSDVTTVAAALLCIIRLCVFTLVSGARGEGGGWEGTVVVLCTSADGWQAFVF